MKRRLKDYFLISLKGMAMGAADVVPGVSGGTIAFISGIYQELIESINKVNLEAFKILRTEGVKSAWKYVNGNFFLALFLGIGISILSLAKGIKYLLETQPIGVWSFFFGLMLSSIFFLWKDIKRWDFSAIMAFVLAIFTAYYITIIPPMSSNQGLLFLFFAGALAVCAMILPGISGAFILVLLGAYHTVLSAIDTFDVKIIMAIGLGALVGLLSFAKILKWLFENKKNTTMAGLTGFIIGSLNKVWPWKQVLDKEIDAHGKEIILLEKSILPTSFEGESQIFLAIILAIIGFLLIYGIEKWASKIK
ncbi:MAG: DUF368 domain-containing protein [Flavobacteriaceae bacterium]|nr:DUF368 domain-containing protein [Flavobacteriaceae bacterium]